MMVFPHFDPVAIHIGDFGIRWYALAYIAGILLGWWVIKRLYEGPFKHTGLKGVDIDDFSTWAVLGIVFGGRIGYVLFYDWPRFAHNPIEALAIWEGGMSFHGGALGTIAAIFIFCWLRKLPVLSFGDTLTSVVPFGLMFGRLANFINGELVGRPTSADFPLAMIFPHVDALPRHPSQLYEAFAEGLVLLCILQFAAWKTKLPLYPGAIAGLFLCGYGLARFLVEYTREPDAQLGYLSLGLSMGQWLCVPMMLIGFGLFAWARFSKR